MGKLLRGLPALSQSLLHLRSFSNWTFILSQLLDNRLRWSYPYFLKGDGIMPMEYPAEVKRKVIRRREKGESIKDLSQELHIAQSTIYH